MLLQPHFTRRNDRYLGERKNPFVRIRVKPNILCIADHPDNMMLVQRAPEARGYRLLKATRGLDGMPLLKPSRLLSSY